jgi:hypothetical protein
MSLRISGRIICGRNCEGRWGSPSDGRLSSWVLTAFARYDDFPHGWTGLADYATDKVMEGNYSSVCLTLGYDSHGRGRPINAGVLTIGTNGKELFWDDETLQKSLDACYVNVSMGDNSPEYLDFEVISVAVRTGVSNSS